MIRLSSKRTSIRTRVLILALAPTLVVLLALAGFFTAFRTSEIEASLAQRGAAIARHVARAAEFGLFSGDRRTLQAIADDARAEEDVASITIFDAAGMPMAQSGRAAQPAAPRESGPVFFSPVAQSLLQVEDIASAPNAAAPLRLGNVRVEMSPQASETAKRTVWLITAVIGSLCLIVAAFIALAIGRGVTGPIRRQAQAIRAIAGGDLTVRVDTDSGGELLDLAEGINRMSAALQASQSTLESRIVQATEQLQMQKDVAEQASEAKSRFLAAASHDLRQPLHAIELFAAALRGKVRGRETQELSQKLKQAIDAMDAQFIALLDIYQLDAGVLKPQVRPFPVQELFNGLEGAFRNDALTRGLRLAIVPTRMVACSDPALVYRILSNLASNALRYTSRGTVMICCRRDAAGLRLEVRDSGPGIDPAEQENVFREFYRVEGSRRERGMGLGLSIVGRMAALLGTRVTLRSQPGSGCVFSVALPRDSEPEPPPALSPGRPQALRAAHLAVLIVDNDPLVLQSTVALTRQWNLHVVTAAGVGEAQRVLRSLTHETVLVLTDLWLSNDEDGIQLLDTLRLDTARTVYGVVVTGDTRPETADRIRSAGYLVLHKPVSAAKLRATFMYYAGKPRSGEPGA